MLTYCICYGNCVLLTCYEYGMKQITDERAATMVTFVWDIIYNILFSVAKPSTLQYT